MVSLLPHLLVPPSDPFPYNRLHLAYLRAEATGRDVIVVGGAKSAIDCAVEASEAGARSVTLLSRQAHWPIPRRILGVIPFQWVFFSRLGQVRRDVICYHVLAC